MDLRKLLLLAGSAALLALLALLVYALSGREAAPDEPVAQQQLPAPLPAAAPQEPQEPTDRPAPVHNRRRLFRPKPSRPRAAAPLTMARMPSMPSVRQAPTPSGDAGAARPKGIPSHDLATVRLRTGMLRHRARVLASTLKLAKKSGEWPPAEVARVSEQLQELTIAIERGEKRGKALQILLDQESGKTPPRAPAPPPAVQPSPKAETVRPPKERPPQEQP